jgi:hypothetical protein
MTPEIPLWSEWRGATLKLDQRSKRVHFTERGYTAAQTIRQAVREIEADLETELGPEQFTQLRQLLVELNATDTTRNHKPRPVA